MKLFPAIVSMHLLGAYVLLALLTLQSIRTQLVEVVRPARSAASPWVVGALALLFVQAASGAWVSTNYAVLACSEFPQCQGQWWPDMDFAQGFEVWRPLGESADGRVLSFQALTAIHVVHRLLALVTASVLGVLAWQLLQVPVLRIPARWLGALVLLQLATGLSNVVLGWPMAAAILHTGGAAAMVAILVWMWTLCKAGVRQ
jgi:cytochrome c oxidase assembly protein subunit 15